MGCDECPTCQIHWSRQSWTRSWAASTPLPWSSCWSSSLAALVCTCRGVKEPFWVRHLALEDLHTPSLKMMSPDAGLECMESVSAHTLQALTTHPNHHLSCLCVCDSPWLQEAAKHADKEGESVPLRDAASPRHLLGDVQLQFPAARGKVWVPGRGKEFLLFPLKWLLWNSF